MNVNVRVRLKRRQRRIRRHDGRPNGTLLDRQSLSSVRATSVVRHPSARKLVELVNRLLNLVQERRVQPLAADLVLGRRARDCRGLEAATANEPVAECALVVPRLAAEATEVGLGLHVRDHAILRGHAVLGHHGVMKNHTVVRAHSIARTIHVRSDYVRPSDIGPSHGARERASKLRTELSSLGSEGRGRTRNHSMLRLGSRSIVTGAASTTLKLDSRADSLRHVDGGSRKTERRFKALLGRDRKWTTPWALERGLQGVRHD